MAIACVGPGGPQERPRSEPWQAAACARHQATCQEVWGILQTNDIVYEIEPKRLSTTFEHLLYRRKSEETQLPPMRCGLTDEEIARQLNFPESANFTLMQSGYEGWWTHRRLLELAVVVEHNRYLHHRSNTTAVQYEVLLVVNAVDKFLRSLDVDVVLMGVEVWTEKNPVPIDTIEGLLKEFCKWKKTSLNNRIPNDVAHLFVKHSYGTTAGLAYIKTVCKSYASCGVDSFMNDNVYDFAHIMSHEIGHNLGMDHDGPTCTCGHKTCIMHEGNESATRFSNCSYADFMNMMGSIARKNCLYISSNTGNIFTLARLHSQRWGCLSKSANQSCYTEINTQGDRFGNCGFKHSTYVKCDISDTLCGRIQCDNVTELPLLRNHSTVHWTQFNGATCWGTDYHFGMTDPDIGDVKDGTECGAEHVCITRKCVHRSLLVNYCSPEMCNLKGVCNNKQHCHCNYESDPPNCIKEGSGGSIDSGPPPRKKIRKKTHYLQLLWLIPFILLLCLLVLCFLTRRRTDKSEEQNVSPSAE
ncbi:PREDICTED: disintegrin and metalloproteinase domain-containing protein 25-like [Myotis davidii]|uniref:disintegrin and metalloproteinase domain-containing protein 25-like n=1 Tax=Myotis davidii TaxID=225400 RepID=UPI0003EC066D|nr:PREDICTED: disintegrin and metalloproteinase domain-containing protein 25-like [Myotis davidii]